MACEMEEKAKDRNDQEKIGKKEDIGRISEWLASVLMHLGNYNKKREGDPHQRYPNCSLILTVIPENQSVLCFN